MRLASDQRDFERARRQWHVRSMGAAACPVIPKACPLVHGRSGSAPQNSRAWRFRAALGPGGRAAPARWSHHQRSRSAPLLCAIRTSGAVQAAMTLRTRFRRMNGYGSHRRRYAERVSKETGDPPAETPCHVCHIVKSTFAGDAGAPTASTAPGPAAHVSRQSSRGRGTPGYSRPAVYQGITGCGDPGGLV